MLSMEVLYVSSWLFLQRARDYGVSIEGKKNIGPRQGYDSRLECNAQDMGTKLNYVLFIDHEEEPYHGVRISLID